MRTLDDRLNRAGDEARLRVDQINTRSATSIRSRQQRSRILVGTVAVAAMFIVLGASGLVMSIEAGQESASEPSAPPVSVAPVAVAEESVPTPTSPPETVVVPPPETMWERITDEELSPGAIWGVASTDDVIVAVGEVPDPDDYVPTLDLENPDGAVWVSTDGHAWERIDDGTVFGGQGAQFLADVVSGPLGFVASGFVWPDAALWFSPDGYEWHKVLVDDLGTPNVAIGFVVAAGGPGWVAANLDEGRANNVAAVDDPDSFGVIDDPSNSVFVSQDGLEWTKVEDVAAIDEFVAFVESAEEWDLISDILEPGVYWDFIRDGDRVVAVARDNSVSIQISDDSGVTWHRVDPEQVAFDEGWPRPQSLGVTFFGSQIIVGGNAQDDAAIWIGTWLEEQ